MKIVLLLSAAQAAAAWEKLAWMGSSEYAVPYSGATTGRDESGQITSRGWTTCAGNSITVRRVPGLVAEEWRVEIESTRHALGDESNGVGLVVATIAAGKHNWPESTLTDGSILSMESASNAPWWQSGVRDTRTNTLIARHGEQTIRSDVARRVLYEDAPPRSLREWATAQAGWGRQACTGGELARLWATECSERARDGVLKRREEGRARSAERIRARIEDRAALAADADRPGRCRRQRRPRRHTAMAAA